MENDIPQHADWGLGNESVRVFAHNYRAGSIQKFGECAGEATILRRLLGDLFEEYGDDATSYIVVYRGVTHQFLAEHAHKNVDLLVKTILTRHPRTATPHRVTKVPQTAEFILDLLLSEKNRDAVLGDLEEQYAKRVAKYGERKAKLWLYKQVVTSMWPLLWNLFKLGLGEYIRRHIG